MYIDTEMIKFCIVLDELHVPYEIVTNPIGGYQILGAGWDAISNEYSIGGRDGYLELWSKSWCDAVGFLTADTALQLLREKRIL